jgi:hypothetical protein
MNINGQVTAINFNRDIVLKEKIDKNAIIYIVNKKGEIVSRTNKFILQAINEADAEKVQVTETFVEDAPSIFFFGKKTPAYTFMGKLLNASVDTENPFSTDVNPNSVRGEWVKGFKHYWNEKLRGSKLLSPKDKKYAPYIALMVVEDTFYKGYPMALNVNRTSADEYSAAFSMTWIITQSGTLLEPSALMTFMEGIAEISVDDLNKLAKLYAYKDILDSIKAEIDRAVRYNHTSEWYVSLGTFSTITYNDVYSSNPSKKYLLKDASLPFSQLEWSDEVLELLTKPVFGDEADKPLPFLGNLTGKQSLKISTEDSKDKPDPAFAYYKQLSDRISYMATNAEKQYNLIIKKLGEL